MRIIKTEYDFKLLVTYIFEAVKGCGTDERLLFGRSYGLPFSLIVIQISFLNNEQYLQLNKLKFIKKDNRGLFFSRLKSIRNQSRFGLSFEDVLMGCI